MPVLYNLHLTACFCFCTLCFCTTFVGLFAFPLHTASSNVDLVKTDLFREIFRFYIIPLQKHKNQEILHKIKASFALLQTPITFGIFEKSGEYVAGVG